MKIIQRYVLTECILPFFLALGVLTCIFLLGNLINLANLVINKGISLQTVGKVFLLYVPVLLGYTLPIACLISVILSFSRMSADNEILAIRSSGIYLKQILYPLVFVGFILSLGSVILNEKVIPYAHYKQRQLLKTLGSQNPTAFLEAGVFVHAFQNQIIFIHRIEGNKMFNITIYQPQPDGKPTRTIIAKRGEFTPIPGTHKLKLKLIEGTSDEPNLKNPNSFYKLNFGTYFMDLDLSQGEKKEEKKPKSMTLKELQTEIARLQPLLVDTTRLETEYHRKISWSFSALVFILLGFPMAVITHKRQKAANVMLAMVSGSFYYLMSLGFEALSIQSLAPPGIAMWMPNIIAGSLAGYLNYKLLVS